MTLLKIYDLEATEEVVCTLSEGEHVVGRGGILNCNDKRVSRKHAVINVNKEFVSIKAVHINPCFFKAVNGNNITILPKDTSVVLSDGDRFALLADMFWFRVRIIWNNDPGVYVRNDISEKLENEVERGGNTKISTINNDTVPFKSELTAADISLGINCIPSTSKRCSDDESSTNSKRPKVSYENVESNTDTSDKNVSCKENTFKHPESPSNLDVLDASKNISQNNTSKKENLVANIDSSKLINNLKNILEEDYGSKNEVKCEDTKSKDVPAGDSKIVPSSNEISNSNVVEIKQEVTDGSVKVKQENLSQPEEKSNETKGEHSNLAIANSDRIKTEQTADNSTVKNENNSADTNQNDPSCSTDGENKKKTRRERCWYGPNCYRKNPVHRLNFSHPGEDDYESDPDDDRPQCPFGAACYRKNLDHRRQFRHSNPPVPKPNGGDGTPKKKRKSPKKKPKRDDSSQDTQDDNNGGVGTATRKPRAAAANKLHGYTYDTPEDDYDFEDPFIDDGSSDAFELSSDEDDEESDWEDSQEVDEQSQETRRLLKEAKRFTKGKGNTKDT